MRNAIDLLILLTLIYLLWAELLPRLRNHSRHTQLEQISTLYRSFTRTIELAGIPSPPPTYTPLEFWLQTSERLTGTAAAVKEKGERFINLLMHTRYAPGGLTREGVHEIRRALSEVKQAVKRDVPLYHRIARRMVQTFSSLKAGL